MPTLRLSVEGTNRQAGSGLAVDFSPAPPLRQSTRGPCCIEAHFDGEFADHGQHRLPLGKHNHLAVRLVEEVVQDVPQLFKLAAGAQVGSTTAGVSQTMRMQANSCSSSSNRLRQLALPQSD